MGSTTRTCPTTGSCWASNVRPHITSQEQASRHDAPGHRSVHLRPATYPSSGTSRATETTPPNCERDGKQKGQKVSLHDSGKQHISIDRNSPSTVNLTDKQFMNQWHEPDEGIATFRLVFPPWGIQLNEQQREKFHSTWKKNDIYIEGHHEFLTVVSFFIVGEGTTLRKRGEFPGFLLGELPLKADTKLSIVAEWEPQRELKPTIERALRGTRSFVNMVGKYPNQTLAACVTGTCGIPNSIYMVSFPVVYSGAGSQEQTLSAP